MEDVFNNVGHHPTMASWEIPVAEIDAKPCLIGKNTNEMGRITISL